MTPRIRSEIVPVDAGLPPAPEPEPAHPFEIWISNTLRIGVSIAALVLAFGLLLFFIHGHEAGEPANLHQLIHSSVVSVRLPTILAHVRHLHAADVLRLGVLALILTPVIRVAMTAVLFIAQRDWVFLVVVLLVLAILLVGLTGVAA